MTKYLYNGIELPALPEYDKTAYPYAVIEKSQYGENLYYFHAFTEAPTMDGNNVWLNGNRIYCSSNNGKDWGTFYNGVANYYGKVFIKWTNTDILNTDGTIYLAATDPVPVLSWADKTPYRRINGQWVKQDTYKRVNGEWVKQDEYRRES